MALKFLNKKGWHTGSLRNIENVWKAEQKHDAEQKKLEELRKQILEERERSEYRLLQEQAGLVPKQERLEFLYDSGLAVGKGSSDGFKALEALPSNDVASSSSAKQQPSVPGALFEEKPQSANDTWRKLHSDPLLMIRQREQEALAHIKNNPVQMAMIRKSVEEKKPKEKKHDRKEEKKLHHKSSKHHTHSSSRHQSENVTPEEERRKDGSHKRSNYEEKAPTDSEDESGERGRLKRKKHHKELNHKERSNYDKTQQDLDNESGDRERPRDKRHHKDLKHKERSNYDKTQQDLDDESGDRERPRDKRHHKDLKHKERPRDKRQHQDLKHKERSNYDKTQQDLDNESGDRERPRDKRQHQDLKHKERSNYDKTQQDLDDESGDREKPRDKRHHKDLKYKEQTSSGLSDLKSGENDNLERIKNREKSKHDKYSSGERKNNVASREETGSKKFSQASHSDSPANRHESHYRRRNTAPKLSEEERAARLREMQMDVELHEEQRRKRLRKAEENDAQEATQAGISQGRDFLDATHKSVYGAEKGGSSTIEESVRRRTHYLQGRSEVGEGNAFRR
ncbi:unnamed protein product, partial [Vitis vinifera]